MPYWVLIVMLVPLPAWYVAGAARRRARRETWRCIECGYDLRASPERCPECGTTVPRLPAFLVRRVRLSSVAACAIGIMYVAAGAVLFSRGSPHVLTNAALFPWAGFGAAGAVVLMIAARQRGWRTWENRHVLVAAAVTWAVGLAVGMIGAIDRGFGISWSI